MLVTQNHEKAGAKTGLYLVNGQIRKLTPRECARVQGFPDSFKIINSISQSYKQFGNSVAVNVLIEILSQIYLTNCFYEKLKTPTSVDHSVVATSF